MPRIPKPVLHLKMEGNAKDSSGYDNHGTVTAATLTDDRLGNPNSAYSFNGSSAFIDCGNDSSLNITGAITIEAWIKPTEENNQAGIVSRWGDGENLRSYLFNLTTANKVQGAISNDGISVYISLTTTTISQNIYQHLVMVYIPNDDIYIYINSEIQPVTNTGLITDSILSSTKKTIIGGWRDVPAAATLFNGIISDPRVYPVALTPTQVRYLYDTTKRKYGRQVA